MRYATFFSHLEAEAQVRMQKFGYDRQEALSRTMADSIALGCDGMTMGYTELTEENLELVRKNGMRVDLVYWNSRLGYGEDGDMLQEVAEKVASTGADVLMLLPGDNVKDISIEDAWKNAIPLTQKLVKFCEAVNVHCGMENLGGATCSYSTVAGVKYYLDHVEGLGSVLDIGNCLWQRQDSLEMWDMMKDKIVAVHAKDLSLRKVEGVRQILSPAGDLLTPLPIGDGDMPLKQLIPMIRDTGFCGSVTMENDGYPDNMEFLRRSMAFWKSQV